MEFELEVFEVHDEGDHSNIVLVKTKLVFYVFGVFTK